MYTVDRTHDQDVLMTTALHAKTTIDRTPLRLRRRIAESFDDGKTMDAGGPGTSPHAPGVAKAMAHCSLEPLDV